MPTCYILRLRPDTLLVRAMYYYMLQCAVDVNNACDNQQGDTTNVVTQVSWGVLGVGGLSVSLVDATPGLSFK